MKNILLVIFCFSIAINAYGQGEISSNLPYIEVTGSADIEIEPDEIRLTVILGENKNKEGVKSLPLSEAEKIFSDILDKTGIPKEKVILKNAGSGSYWYSYWYYDRDEDIRLRKEYDIILHNQAELEKLLSLLPGPQQGFIYVNISELKNKNIAEYRKQTKIEAIKAAKAKAEYLLESVGSSVGKLIQVIELDEDDYGWYRPASHSNVISQTSMNASGDNDNSGMKKIKLRYRMKARFEIK